MFTETFRKIQEKEKITNINGTGGNSLTYWTIVPVPISKKKIIHLCHVSILNNT